MHNKGQDNCILTKTSMFLDVDRVAGTLNQNEH
jgi:hypothetical protein